MKAISKRLSINKQIPAQHHTALWVGAAAGSRRLLPIPYHYTETDTCILESTSTFGSRADFQARFGRIKELTLKAVYFNFKQLPESRIHFSITIFPMLPCPQTFIDQPGCFCLGQSSLFSKSFNLFFIRFFHLKRNPRNPSNRVIQAKHALK